MRVGCVGPEQVFRRTEKNTGVILRQPSSLARSSCRRAVVVLVVMLVVVLLSWALAGAQRSLVGREVPEYE